MGAVYAVNALGHSPWPGREAVKEGFLEEVTCALCLKSDRSYSGGSAPSWLCALRWGWGLGCGFGEPAFSEQRDLPVGLLLPTRLRLWRSTFRAASRVPAPLDTSRA